MGSDSGKGVPGCTPRWGKEVGDMSPGHSCRFLGEASRHLDGRPRLV